MIGAKIEHAFYSRGLTHNNDSEFASWENSLREMQQVLSTDDYPYYKELAKDPDARYMKLKLVEKYPVGQYPLKELKENGLTSVQGRSKATVQLMKYLEK